MTDESTDLGPRARVDLARQPEFTLGTMRVRPATREALIGGKPQVLQPRVMQVLVALARRPGEVVSRDDLVASCWEGLAVSEDAINRCIGALRRLSEQSQAFTIETIARVGYRIAADDLPATTSAAAVAAAQTAPVTIAVLPFADMSPEHDQEYFADGLSEELMSQLTRLSRMRVTGRTSSFAFKNKNEDLRAIGQRLGVAHILEGSVRKAGKRLRITAQLIKCDDGYHLWAQTYDRELDDVFAIQEDVARAVTEALGVTLGVGADAPDYGGTKSFEAFDHYLRGRFVPGVLVDAERFRSRVEHLRQAVAIDPDYAAAWASRANLLAFTQNFIPVAAARSLDAERDEAAKRAILLAPELPAANVAEGWRQADERNWLAAEGAFMRSVAPGRGSDPLSEGIVGAYLTNTGRVREGLRFRLRARRADPLGIGWVGHLLGSYDTLGMWDSFDAEYQRSFDLEGDRGGLETFRLTRLMAARASPAEIEAQFAEALKWPDTTAIVRAIADVHATSDRALAVLRQYLGGSPSEVFMIAQLAGFYGDNELAIEALQRALPDARLVLIQWLWGPLLKDARKDQRFKKLVCDVGLPDYWRKIGNWGDFARPIGETDFEIFR